jgi:hypothetical protein
MPRFSLTRQKQAPNHLSQPVRSLVNGPQELALYLGGPFDIGLEQRAGIPFDGG